MKIVCTILEYLHAGGSGTTVSQSIAKDLVRKSYEIHVVTSGMKDLVTRAFRIPEKTLLQLAQR